MQGEEGRTTRGRHSGNAHQRDKNQVESSDAPRYWNFHLPVVVNGEELITFCPLVHLGASKGGKNLSSQKKVIAILLSVFIIYCILLNAFANFGNIARETRERYSLNGGSKKFVFYFFSGGIWGQYYSQPLNKMFRLSEGKRKKNEGKNAQGGIQ